MDIMCTDRRARAVAAAAVATLAVVAVWLLWFISPDRILDQAIAQSAHVQHTQLAGDRPVTVADDEIVPAALPVDPAVAYQPDAQTAAGAAATVTVDDNGREIGAARWQTDTVAYQIVGDAATSTVVADIDRAYQWLSTVTGVHFTRTDDGHAPITIAVNRHADPRTIVVAARRAGTIQRAVASWDPTHPHASRWLYEELGHTVGPLGDYAADPVSVWHHTDQTSAAFTAHDAWLLRTLYAADRTPRSRSDATDLYRTR